MKVTDYFTGNYSHTIWKNRVSLLLIVEFLGTLMIAWALRPIWVSSTWIYTPFVDHISRLGKGRLEGNIGAWIFLIGFCLFPIIGTGWNSFVFRKFAPVSKIFAWFLWILVEFSMICVSFVGIFDGVWPNSAISGKLHSFGATYAFLGHTISAVIVFIAVSIIYWRVPKESRNMHHPLLFFLVIVELVGMYLIFRIFGGAFFQWLIMLSLMVYVFLNSRLFPEAFPLKHSSLN